MNNKYFIFAILSVLIMTSFASALWPSIGKKNDFESVQLSPIAANSCDVDDTCEVKSIAGPKDKPLVITSPNGIIDMSQGDQPMAVLTDVFGSDFVGSSMGYFFTDNQFEEAYASISHNNATNEMEFSVEDRMNKPGKLRFMNGVTFNKAMAVVGGSFLAQLTVSGATTFTQLKAVNGTGNAYACLDKDGKLFRSTKPCV